MFDDDHDGPPLHVPAEALLKPKGAAVATDGTVACVSCGNRFPLSAVDVVGQGYRCAPCGHQAHVTALEKGNPNIDAGAHLSPHVRDELRRQGQLMLLGGVALLALGVLLIVLLFDTSGMKLGGIVTAGGVGLLVTGSMRKQAAGG